MSGDFAVAAACMLMTDGSARQVRGERDPCDGDGETAGGSADDHPGRA